MQAGVHRLLAPSLCIFLLAAACVDQSPDVADESFDATVCADGETVFGIDVSKWQGTIDWSQVAGDGVDYAFIRVSDGLNYPDGKFAANWAGARKNGVMRGAYQFFRPGQDVVAQVNLFLDAMGALEPDDLPPVIDVEASDGQSKAVVAAKIQQWLDLVQAATGRTPIIYTGKYFWQDNVASPDFAAYPLWIAQYGPTCPNLPSQWNEWAFFQTSSSGRIAGISGNVDTNLFNGSLADLAAFSGPSVCGDGVCSADETLESCAADCPPCQLIARAGGTVDEDGPCFEAGGNLDYMRRESVGIDGSLTWTHTTDDSGAANYGIWNLVFESAGEYTIEAHMLDEFADSTRARYVVEHGAASDAVTVDQSGADGWIELGAFSFDAGGAQWVRLDDNTGEPVAGKTRLAFDALRFTRVDDPGDPGDPSDPVGPTDPGGNSNAGDGPGANESGDGVIGGCAAGGSGSPATGALLLMALALLLGPRRRRRSRL